MQLVDDGLLARLGHRPVHCGLTGGDAETIGTKHRLTHVRGLEQFLGRDTPPMQTGAAHLVLLHHDDP